MKISVIIPNRGGTNFEILYSNFKKYLKNNFELIIVNQDDDDLFKRGQLFNIGYKFAKYDNIIMADNDIIFMHDIDFDLIYNFYKQPFSPWKDIQQCSFINDKMQLNELWKNAGGCGGMNFITKNDFEKINGYSNLYCGWGAEDDEYRKRIEAIYKKWLKIPSIIGHISHPKRNNKNQKNTNYNYLILNDFDKRDFKLDGLNETEYDLISVVEKENIKNIHVKNIRVCKDFKYDYLLKEHYKV